MTLDNFFSWAGTLVNLEKSRIRRNIAPTLQLETTRALLKALGNPENSYKSIHIAGSKGKGTTALAMGKLIAGNGKKCGLYLSPHVLDVRERVSIAGASLPETIYESACQSVYNAALALERTDSAVASRGVTWFEVVTVWAFLCFQMAHVDYAVIEVGLGGLLDCTNVIKPVLSIITAIEKEHQDVLGKTIKEIASQKAGIIKSNTPVIILNQKHYVALKVFKARAKKLNSPLIYGKSFLHISKLRVLTSIEMPPRQKFFVSIKKIKDLPPLSLEVESAMLGSLEAEDFAGALLCGRFLGFDCVTSAIKNAILPGRFQVLGNVVVDGAHTIDSIRGVKKTFFRVFKSRPVVLFGCAADKDYKKLIKIIKPNFLTSMGERTAPLASYKDWVADPLDALKKALSLAKKTNKKVLVVGSFYLAGIIIRAIESNEIEISADNSNEEL